MSDLPILLTIKTEYNDGLDVNPTKQTQGTADEEGTRAKCKGMVPFSRQSKLDLGQRPLRGAPISKCTNMCEVNH